MARSTFAATQFNVFRARVRRGAALAAKLVGPNWYNKIDLDRLEMGMTQDCICGQLSIGRNRITGDSGGWNTLEMSIDNGFFAGEVGEYRKKKEILTRCWKEIITKLRDNERKLDTLAVLAMAAPAKHFEFVGA